MHVEDSSRLAVGSFNKKWAAIWFFVMVIAAFQLFWGLGEVPFIDRDEGEYATVAQSMIQRDDYVIPHVNGRPYYEKPALYFWLMTGSFALFGQNEAAARLPSALAGLVLAGIMGWFGTRRGGRVFGLLSALFTITSLLMALLARVALMDMLLTLWVSMTLIFFFEGYIACSGRDSRFFWSAWAAMGLAFLTKGPVGVAVPVLVVLGLTIWNGNLWPTILRSQIPLGLLIFTAIAGPWYGLAFMREGQNFWQGFFVSQNISRFTDVLLGHGAPLWFYLPVLIIGWWPWSIFAIPRTYKAVTAGRESRKNDPDLALDFFLASWLLGALLLFSLAQTKQPNYILPAGPPLIMLAARWWTDHLSAKPSGRSNGWGIAAAILGLVLAVGLMALDTLSVTAYEKAKIAINVDAFEYAFQTLAPELGKAPLIIGVLTGLAIIAALVGQNRRLPSATLAGFLISLLILVNGLFHGVAPIMLDYLQTPAKTLSLQVGQEMKSGDYLGTYGLYKPTLWFYTGHNIERIKSADVDQLETFLAREKRAWLLSRTSLKTKLDRQPRFRLLKTAGGYLLGDNQGGERSNQEGRGQ
ncbi:MAG: glycosyltransferase family 39 protein [Deltaproteobacteria bacterium]|nr:glycosyltransferase family 39 protein [Deltaproteobacteria bacterium]